MRSRSHIDISDPRILDDLRNALIKFTPEARAALYSIEGQLRATRTWLDDRQKHWEYEIVRRQREVEDAQRALARCQAARRHDDHGNCTAEESRLRTAQHRLNEATRNLKTVRRWQKELQREDEVYKRHALRLRRLLDDTSKRAQIYLKDRRRSLEAYLTLQAGFNITGALFYKLTKVYYSYERNRIGQRAVRGAKREEIALVQQTGIGTRSWSKSELRQLNKGKFPKGYQGHHINNVARFPDLAGTPDNVRFVTRTEHWALHRGSWRNNTSGKMFNRKSLAVQWLNHKN